ncbi:MAG: hypothetical protein LBI10_00910 [Deltaproteobacteria bacterium]|jgi:hypothetical protein|nr:hypothetical protein [Deltaproteobacteria bacterium]
MTKNTKKTSHEIASLASQTLSDPLATPEEKKLAGSALSQANTDKETSLELEQLASSVLHDPKSSPRAKKLAGSVMAQANKER